ncbi:MAG: DUF2069 domain-containing protein [Burkholderiaceae bacterium]
MKPELALPARVVHTRTLALACLLALIALCLAWELWLAPTGRGTLALKALPLVLAVPGVLAWRMYTFRWLSLVLWLYVAEGAVRAASDRGLGAPLALLEVVLCLVLFAACAAHIRWRLKAAKAGVA